MQSWNWFDQEVRNYRIAECLLTEELIFHAEFLFR